MRVNPAIKPRNWQTKALELWVREMRGIARIITGGGKTVFAYMCMEVFLAKFNEGRIVIIVPTIALLDQWYIDLTESTDCGDEDIACYCGGSHPDSPRKINILVLNTARGIAETISGFDTVPKFLIVDECHRAGSPHNALALSGDYRATLGLSATPERESDDGLEERIIPALGDIFFEYDYVAASRDKVIVDFDLINVEIDPESAESIEHTNAAKAFADIADQAAPGDNHSRNKAILKNKLARSRQTALRVPWAVKLALAHQGQRIVIFHERVSSLTHIVSLLERFGQNAVAYHSKLSEPHRRDNLRMFRRGMVNVLVTCRALDEGANVPEANVAVVARSTSSTRQRIQRLGRVLRPAPNKDAAVVYTLYVGENERNRLTAEEQDLVGVARTLWKRGVVT